MSAKRFIKTSSIKNMPALQQSYNQQMLLAMADEHHRDRGSSDLGTVNVWSPRVVEQYAKTSKTAQTIRTCDPCSKPLLLSIILVNWQGSL